MGLLRQENHGSDTLMASYLSKSFNKLSGKYCCNHQAEEGYETQLRNNYT